MGKQKMNVLIPVLVHLHFRKTHLAKAEAFGAPVAYANFRIRTDFYKPGSYTVKTDRAVVTIIQVGGGYPLFSGRLGQTEGMTFGLQFLPVLAVL